LELVTLNVTGMEMPTVLELVSESKAVVSELELEAFSPDQLGEPESLNLLDLVAVSTLEYLLVLVKPQLPKELERVSVLA
jgi:hypothetical protein